MKNEIYEEIEAILDTLHDGYTIEQTDVKLLRTTINDLKQVCLDRDGDVTYYRGQVGKLQRELEECRKEENRIRFKMDANGNLTRYEE